MGGDSFAGHGDWKETYSHKKSMTERGAGSNSRNLVEREWEEFESLNFNGKQKYVSSE